LRGDSGLEHFRAVKRLRVGVLIAAVRVDDVIRPPGFFFLWALGLDAQQSVCFGEPARVHETLLTNNILGNHGPNRVAARVQPGFEKLDGFHDDEVHIGAGDYVLNSLHHQRVHDGFQLTQSAGIFKDQFSQPGAVNLTIRVTHVPAKGFQNGFIGGHAGQISGLCEQIRVNGQRAFVFKILPNCAFP